MSAKSHRGRLGRAVNLAIHKLGSRKRASRAGPPTRLLSPAFSLRRGSPCGCQIGSRNVPSSGMLKGGWGVERVGLEGGRPAEGASRTSRPPQAGRKMLLSPGPGSLRQNLLGGQSPLCPVFPGNRPLGEMTRDLFFPRGLAQSRAQP